MSRAEEGEGKPRDDGAKPEKDLEEHGGTPRGKVHVREGRERGPIVECGADVPEEDEKKCDDRNGNNFVDLATKGFAKEKGASRAEEKRNE